MSDKKEDELKLDFTLDAVEGTNPFATQAAVHQDVADALRWQAERSPQQVCSQREQIMRKLEDEAADLRYASVSGLCHALPLFCIAVLMGADPLGWMQFVLNSGA